ncbi:universal stress protein [Danxiaibacter flavus]|uniref:Universal stress protein n=1 Tax=Danxiaibacter flavus TaxID=3049108 RepID=A0ABV3ZLY8_9BACT|nr:universal stress protein [Chitinophagaceae bacterium DXS]
MQKISVAVDAVDPDRNQLAFACYLAKLTKSKITGVFLENIVAEEKPVIKTTSGRAYLDWAVNERSGKHQAKMLAIDNNIQLFMQHCANEGVLCNVQRKEGVPYREMKDESRFADVIVVSSETSFKKHYEGAPTAFARDVLAHVECPVFVAPTSFHGIKELFFAFDGSAAAMHAIKQFSYILPEYANHRITVLHADDDAEWMMTGYDGFVDWLDHHYNHIEFVTLKGQATFALFDFLIDKEDFLLLMGAYGRSSLSRFFLHSKATTLLNTLAQAMFIAH